MLLAEAVGGEVVGTALEAVVRCEPLTVVLPLDREALARLPGQPPAGRAARLPRHGDDRARDGGGDDGVPRRARLVGGRPIPAGPAHPAGPAERAGPARADRGPHPGVGLARHVQRPRLRLAAPRDPLPDGAARSAGPCRPPRPPAVRPPRLPPPDDRRAAADASRRSCSASSGTRTSRAGRSRGATSTSSGSGSSSRSSRSCATTARTSGRSPGCSSDIEARFADRRRSSSADPGDLAGLARAFAAGAAPRRGAGLPRRRRGRRRPSRERRPTTRTTGGCRAGRSTTAAGGGGPPRRSVTPRVDSPWTEDRILVERARLLRRLGRFAEAADVWEAIGAGAGPLSAHAWIEVAKLREHRLRDLPGAFAAAERARAVIDRRRRIGRFDPALDHALAGRLERLGGASTHGWPRPSRACARSPRAVSYGRAPSGPPSCARGPHARSGTPWQPGTLEHERGRGCGQQQVEAAPIRPPTSRGSIRAAASAARNMSPAPVGSTGPGCGTAG